MDWLKKWIGQTMSILGGVVGSIEIGMNASILFREEMRL